MATLLTLSLTLNLETLWRAWDSRTLLAAICV